VHLIPALGFNNSRVGVGDTNNIVCLEGERQALLLLMTTASSHHSGVKMKRRTVAIGKEFTAAIKQVMYSSFILVLNFLNPNL
jgi:hypothetical protein